MFTNVTRHYCTSRVCYERRKNQMSFVFVSVGSSQPRSFWVLSHYKMFSQKGEDFGTGGELPCCSIHVKADVFFFMFPVFAWFPIVLIEREATQWATSKHRPEVIVCSCSSFGMIEPYNRLADCASFVSVSTIQPQTLMTDRILQGSRSLRKPLMMRCPRSKEIVVFPLL